LLHYPVTLAESALLLLVAAIAGALNSIAGGGSFISFPTLVFLGLPSVNANATNTLGLWPGTMASAGAYRKAMNATMLKRLVPLIIITLAGSLVGAHLLLKTRVATFDRLVPWLLLQGTVLFLFRAKITAGVAQRRQQDGPSRWQVMGVTVAQAALGIYIGYFGAGVGIVMLPLLSLMGIENIHAMSGVRTFMVTCGNAAAIAVFIFAHAVYWPQALLMMLGATAGGYAGAYFAQKMEPKTVSYLVVAIGAGMTAYFFWKTYLRG
jgi:uncharacterized membrane protein YfcA